MPTKDANVGQIVEIKGVVIDAVFPGDLPAIYSALKVEIAAPDGEGQTDLIAEVQQHLGNDRVRAVAMDSTDGLARGTDVVDTGAPISVPVGEATLGRIFNVLGDSIDGGDEVDVKERWPIHRPAPDFEDLVPTHRDLRDGDQGHRPPRPVREGRQGRALRRRRRGQDGADPGAHPQHRRGARGALGVRRRRRADARGQRPLARDDRVGRHRQDRARLRPDERAAGSAPARGPERPDHGGVLPRGRPGHAALHRQHLPLRAGGLRGVGAPRPHAVRGGLPADARDRDGPAPGADHLDAQGLGHVGAGDLRAGRRPHRPGAGGDLRAPRRVDGALARDRRAGDLPGRRPARLVLARAPAGHRRRGALPHGDGRAGDAPALQGAPGHHRHPRDGRALGRGPARSCSAPASSSGSSRSRSSSPSSSPAARAST